MSREFTLRQVEQARRVAWHPLRTIFVPDCGFYMLAVTGDAQVFIDKGDDAGHETISFDVQSRLQKMERLSRQAALNELPEGWLHVAGCDCDLCG